MPVFELGKSIESIRLNKRNRLPLGEQPRTIPFGALVEEIAERGDRASFIYLGELYECGADLLRSALLQQEPGGGSADAPMGAARPERVQNAEPKRLPSLAWEPLESTEGLFSRARVPGGWLVTGEGKGLVFVPDERGSW